VATSSGSESVDVKTKNHQALFQLFHHVVMGSSDAEVKHGKPAPDIFLVAAQRFPDKPHPDQVDLGCNDIIELTVDLILDTYSALFLKTPPTV
jgi:hypothetical protein